MRNFGRKLSNKLISTGTRKTNQVSKAVQQHLIRQPPTSVLKELASIPVERNLPKVTPPKAAILEPQAVLNVDPHPPTKSVKVITPALKHKVEMPHPINQKALVNSYVSPVLLDNTVAPSLLDNTVTSDILPTLETFHADKWRVELERIIRDTKSAKKELKSSPKKQKKFKNPFSNIDLGADDIIDKLLQFPLVVLSLFLIIIEKIFSVGCSILGITVHLCNFIRKVFNCIKSVCTFACKIPFTVGRLLRSSSRDVDEHLELAPIQ